MKHALLVGGAVAALAVGACAQGPAHHNTTTEVAAAPQSVPQSAPTNPTAGGSALSRDALARLVANGIETNTLQNLEGPAGPATYVRSRISTHQVRPDELPGVEGYVLRTSFVDVGAGEFVPVHSHADRPAVATVISGEVWHHGSDGLSYLMEPGVATASAGGIAEWWYNEGDETARIWIVDLCGDAHGCGEEILGDTIDLGGPDRGPVANPPQGEGPSNAEVLITVDLAPEFPEAAAAIGDRQLRLRRVEWAPGRIVPPHAHVGRPTFIWMQQGDFTFYDYSGSQVIEEDSVVIERGAVQHAWANNGEETVVLYAVDIFNPTTN